MKYWIIIFFISTFCPFILLIFFFFFIHSESLLILSSTQTSRDLLGPGDTVDPSRHPDSVSPDIYIIFFFFF